MKRFAWEVLLLAGALSLACQGCNSSMYHVMDDDLCVTNECTSACCE